MKGSGPYGDLRLEERLAKQGLRCEAKDFASNLKRKRSSSEAILERSVPETEDI